MGFLYRFFCWCSGARLYILKQCPSDYNKFFGIGIIIVLTGMMAALSGGYAVLTIFNSVRVAAVLGLFWGIIIFFIDWYLISSLKKEKKFLKELAATLPRLILAVFLAIIIAKPLEMRLFEKEIQRQIELNKRDYAANYNKIIDREFDQIQKLEQRNDQLLQEIKEKENKRNELFKMIVEEAEGRSPVGIPGKGPVYKEKKNQLNRIEQELTELKNFNLNLIEENNRKIEELRSQKNNKLASATQANKNYDGFLARLEAFGTLSAKNEVIRTTNWVIMILFVLIESAPVFVKLISRRGPYDEILELEEYQKLVDTKKEMTKLQAEAGNRIFIEEELNKIKTNSDIESSRDYIERMKKAKLDINKIKVENWKKSELAEIQNNNNGNHEGINEEQQSIEKTDKDKEIDDGNMENGKEKDKEKDKTSID